MLSKTKIGYAHMLAEKGWQRTTKPIKILSHQIFGLTLTQIHINLVQYIPICLQISVYMHLVLEC